MNISVVHFPNAIKCPYSPILWIYQLYSPLSVDNVCQLGWTNNKGSPGCPYQPSPLHLKHLESIHSWINSKLCVRFKTDWIDTLVSESRLTETNLKFARAIPGCNWPWPLCIVTMATNETKYITCHYSQCVPFAESWEWSAIINHTWKEQWRRRFLKILPETDSGCCSSSLPCQLHGPAALWRSYPGKKSKIWLK